MGFFTTAQAFFLGLFSAGSLLAIGLAYLLGSIPFGLILTRLAGTQDLRSIGSGNIGATNVLRTGRKDLAVATLLLDGLKGTLAVVVGLHFDESLGLAAALGAFLGHLYPVWLGFKGGKGVATFLGCLFGFAWPVALIACAVWLAIAWATRYSSTGALGASLAAPIAFAALGQPPAATLFLLLAALLWWRHRENIARLRAGTEGKIGQKA
jgi:acyl phosphate:glycerol-3-phosphate acyltransferase